MTTPSSKISVLVKGTGEPEEKTSWGRLISTGSVNDLGGGNTVLDKNTKKGGRGSGSMTESQQKKTRKSNK